MTTSRPCGADVPPLHPFAPRGCACGSKTQACVHAHAARSYGRILAMPDATATPLEELAVIVDPARDDVAVAKQSIAAGAVLSSPAFGRIVVAVDIAMGHRIAVRDVPAGSWV